MKSIKFIFILPFLWWGFDAKAQMPQEQEPASMPEQWQLTLDVIKSKAQTLMIQNNGLQNEYQQLLGQVQKLRQSIYTQQNKNEEMSRFLNKRHGRTDQQARIEELTQMIKTKKQEAQTFDEQLGNLTRKQSGLDQKIQALKYTISNIELHQQAEKQEVQAPQQELAPRADDQLSQLRAELEDQNKQEVLLENEVGSLKTGGKMQNLNVDAIEEENKQLEARLDILRLQKLRRERKSSDNVLAEANGRMYNKLKNRKDQLEINIYAYETRLDQLRESSLMSFSWPLKKKKLVHTMVQADARNNQMRDKIKVLHEDIEVLKDQVTKLERRVNVVQNKFVDFKSTP